MLPHKGTVCSLSQVYNISLVVDVYKLMPYGMFLLNYYLTSFLLSRICLLSLVILLALKSLLSELSKAILASFCLLYFKFFIS